MGVVALGWAGLQGAPAGILPSLDDLWLVKLPVPIDPEAAARAAGARYVGPVQGVSQWHRFSFSPALEEGLGSVPMRTLGRQRLISLPEVLHFEPVVWLDVSPRAAFSPGDPLFKDQWHLENVGQTGGLPLADVRARPVWDQGITGMGVVVGVVDEGIQYQHPDLGPNWLTGFGRDYNDDDNDPSPSGVDDRHGTAVAGIILAASNGLGGLGVAHQAQLVPLRLIAGPISAGEDAEALSYRRDVVDIYNNSWGPSDDNGVRYADSSQVVKDALAESTTVGRQGLGNIYVWAAGNGGLSGDNSNYDGYNSLPYTISVAAVGHDDVVAGYSEPGANLLVAAPSQGRGPGITTTDNTGTSGYAAGDYFTTFNGTSAAAPMVSGVVALMLQARPQLNWRDVQQVLARTAVPVDFEAGGWERNGAGLWVSHNYGFGRVDAEAAVALAREWDLLPPAVSVKRTQFRNLALTDGSLRTGSISITDSFEVQFVRVTLIASHPNWGDLSVELISPDGTRSVLAEPHSNFNTAGQPGSWTYLSTRHLGESANGIWTLEVTDSISGDTGTWTNWSLELIGHNLGARSNRAPVAADLDVEGISFPVEINPLAGVIDPNGDAVQVINFQYPREGNLERLANGRFIYSEGGAGDGLDYFSVLLRDGRGGVLRRMVRIADPRPSANNDLFTVRRGQSVDLPVLANDRDLNGDTIRIIGADAPQGGLQPVILSGSQLRLTVPADASAVLRFPYRITDDVDGASEGWVTLVVQDPLDVAVRLDGEDDLVLVPPTTAINLVDRFTVEAWIKPAGWGEHVTGFGRIVDRGTFIFFLNGFDHGFYNDQSLVVFLETLDSTGAVVETAANTAANVLELDRWQHVAVSYNSSDSQAPVRIYVDGQSVPVTYPSEVGVRPTRPLVNSSGFPLRIGESASGARAFKGEITDVRIWNRVVDALSIRNNHDRRLVGNESGLQLYLPFTGGLGTSDASAGAFKGSVELQMGASRVPRSYPWSELENHYDLVVDAGNGWWLDRSIGWVYGDAFPWVVLDGLGWAYAGHLAGASAYVHYPVPGDWGWLLTSPALFPWHYRFGNGSWLYQWPDEPYTGWFYDASGDSWLQPVAPPPGN